MIFASAFIAFAVLHSLLASRKLKSALISRFPKLKYTYRMFYNLFALFNFGLLWFFAPVRDVLLYSLDPPLSLLLHLVQAAALLGIWQSVRIAGTGSFTGLTQIKDGMGGHTHPYDLDEPANENPIAKGPFRKVRHPLYVFSIILLAAHPYMTFKWMIFTMMATLYFVIGSRFEEKRLEARFGESYRSYKEKVPAFIPRFFNEMQDTRSR